jgi:putative transposase
MDEHPRRRKYQFWERNSLSVELFTTKVLYQKLLYIHNNPVVKSLCVNAVDYKWSSAKFYATDVDDFDMLTHCDG